MAKKPKYRTLHINEIGEVQVDRAVATSISMPRGLWKRILIGSRKSWRRPSNLVTAVLNKYLDEFLKGDDFKSGKQL